MWSGCCCSARLQLKCWKDLPSVCPVVCGCMSRCVMSCPASKTSDTRLSLLPAFQHGAMMPPRYGVPPPAKRRNMMMPPAITMPGDADAAAPAQVSQAAAAGRVWLCCDTLACCRALLLR